MKKATLLLLFIAITLLATAQQQYPFQDSKLTIDQRVEDLVGRMTLEEKISQMQYWNPPIERFGIPRYNWWNECLHGVGRTKYKVTVFPQAIGMAATFDPVALKMMGQITSDEARAIYNEAIKKNNKGEQYEGLTFWTPNINIFRDPRWGRGQETYGEDPYLTSIMGSAIVSGLQGDDPTYMKVSACAKHFAVHSGPEQGRSLFNAQASAYDLWDTYLPAFRELVVNAGVSSVMCAYNRFEGQPCCGNDKIMMRILRDKWAFKGYVTSDCGAIDDFYKNHKTHPNAQSAAADAVLHGTDLDCGWEAYRALGDAIKNGLITEAQIDVSVKRLFKTRFLLGMFDKAEDVPFSKIGLDVIECDAHKKHALEMARKSVVLLKNANNILPLSKNLKKIVVMGPNANDKDVLLANYNGFATTIVTPFEGIKQTTGAEVVFVQATGRTSSKQEQIDEALLLANGADVVVFVGGLSPQLEGESGDAGREQIEGFIGGDRTTIALPKVQTEMMKRIKEMNIPLIYVNISGSAIGFEWEAENADAIMQAWYGGQSAGTAVADVIFGDYNPSGRLPVTFYRNDKDLPDFLDYSMANRTYRYFKGSPLYPFGFGMSYTTFKYSNLKMPKRSSTNGKITVTCTITNTGSKDGEEVAQLYVAHKGEMDIKPICSLQGIERIQLKAGESKQVTFSLSPENMSLVDSVGTRVIMPEDVQIYVGKSSPSAAELSSKKQSGVVRLTGEQVELN